MHYRMTSGQDIPEEWLSDYLSRSGADGVNPRNVIVNEHGFASYELTKNDLWIVDMYGDGAYWFEHFENMARELGKKKVCGFTERNPNAWGRKYGYRLKAYMMEKEL